VERKGRKEAEEALKEGLELRVIEEPAKHSANNLSKVKKNSLARAGTG
jgi:hypothetical protein